jgi:hypothetical protein
MVADSEHQLDASWREAIRLVYEQQVIEGGNEGPREHDRWLPPRKVRIRDAAIDFIARKTGTAPGYVRNALTEAAHNYGTAPGTEADPNWLAPPDWTAFVVGWETHTEIVMPMPMPESTGIGATHDAR